MYGDDISGAGSQIVQVNEKGEYNETLSFTNIISGGLVENITLAILGKTHSWKVNL